LSKLANKFPDVIQTAEVNEPISELLHSSSVHYR
jgi:hypothetical protein